MPTSLKSTISVTSPQFHVIKWFFLFRGSFKSAPCGMSRSPGLPPRLSLFPECSLALECGEKMSLEVGLILGLSTNPLTTTHLSKIMTGLEENILWPWVYNMLQRISFPTRCMATMAIMFLSYNETLVDRLTLHQPQWTNTLLGAAVNFGITNHMSF